MAKIRNKKTGKEIEVNEDDLHIYGLGRKKLPKAGNGFIQENTANPTYEAGKIQFSPLGKNHKFNASRGYYPIKEDATNRDHLTVDTKINLGDTTPKYYDFGDNPYEQYYDFNEPKKELQPLPQNTATNYTYPAQDYGELDESEYSNGQYQQKRPYQMDKLPTQLIPEQQAPQFRPLSEDTEDTENTKSGFNWKNGINIASKFNEITKQGQMATKGFTNNIINNSLTNRDNFRKATQFGQLAYADAENRPQGQIYGKDIRGGNALFANGGINLKELYTPETNKANIEVEKNEFISIPHMDNGGHSGLSEKVNFGGSHGEITNGSSGTPMNLPANTLVFSVQNKVKKTPLLAPLLEDGLLKAGDIGKPWSSVANKFKTVDDVNRKGNKFDSIQNTTADIIINMKQAKLKRLFEEGQEPEKLYGFQGKKAQLEAIQSLQQEQQMQPEQEQNQQPIAKYGMKLPIAKGGNKVRKWNKKKDIDFTKVYNGNEQNPVTINNTNPVINTPQLPIVNQNNTQPSVNSNFTGVNPFVDIKSLRLSPAVKKRRDEFLPFTSQNTPDVYGNPAYRESVFKDFEDRSGVKLNRANSDAINLEGIRNFQNQSTPELTKDYKLNFTRGNQDLYNEFTKQKGYKKSKDNTKESNNFYDWATANKKLTKDYADSGKWGHEYYNTATLDFETEAEYNKWRQDPDWEQVGNRFVDRSGDPNGVITYYDINKKWENKPAVKQPASDPVDPTQYKFKSGVKQQGFDMPNINMGIPLPYNEKTTPLNYYKIQPEFIDPRYRNSQAQRNDSLRGFRTMQNNIGGRGTTDIANLAQGEINLQNNLDHIYEEDYNYNKQQDSQAQQSNVQTEMNTRLYNQNSWYNQLEDFIRARSSAKNKQFKENQQRSLENWNEQMAFNNNSEYMRTFNPGVPNQFNWGANLNPVDVKKAKESKWNDEIEKEQYIKQKKAELGIAKNGGKVRIKPKIKLK